MKSITFSKILPKGSVLVFSLIILSLMLVTALTILSSALLDRKASLSTGSSTRSFQVADSGVEEVLYQVYKKDHATLSALASAVSGTCSGNSVRFNVAGGNVTVSFYQDGASAGTTDPYSGGCSGTDWRDKVVKIQSNGTSGTTTRAVEVAVAAAGGGITGGCRINATSVISEKWGNGCKANGTALISSTCASASDTAYSCGATSNASSVSFCLCVSN